jgi:hypothetical protein
VFAGRLNPINRVVPEARNESGRFIVADQPTRILITDSDPQYICLSFDLGDNTQSNAETPVKE